MVRLSGDRTLFGAIEALDRALGGMGVPLPEEGYAVAWDGSIVDPLDGGALKNDDEAEGYCPCDTDGH